DRLQNWRMFDGNEPAISSTAPQAEAVWTNAAITLTSRLGRVSIDPRDARQPVFREGRFFFDCGSQFEGTEDALYSLITNRAVLRRAATNFARITGFWSLPTELQSGADPVILSVT